MKLDQPSGGQPHQPWGDGNWYVPHYYTTEREARDHAAQHVGAQVLQSSPAGLTRRQRGEPKDEGIWRADIPVPTPGTPGYNVVFRETPDSTSVTAERGLSWAAARKLTDSLTSELRVRREPGEYIIEPA